MDDDTIKKARQTDLAQYLISVGVPLVKSGKRYKHKDYDSLVFTKNSYYWNSRNERGNSIDYLCRHMGMNFLTAIESLVDFVPSDVDLSSEFDKLVDIEVNNDFKRVIAYLNKSRGISYNTIKYLIDIKHLCQEKDTNNAVFTMYDELDNYVGAELVGTLSNMRFKNVKAGSKYGYGFNTRYTKNNTFDYVLFFESAIDLISFIDIKKNQENKSLSQCLLVSMAGLKINILRHTLEVFNGDLKVVLCVDNDTAGENFIDFIKASNIKFSLNLPKSDFKDWNEQLLSGVKN